jgi:hypothetical protein
LNAEELSILGQEEPTLSQLSELIWTYLITIKLIQRSICTSYVIHYANPYT